MELAHMDRLAALPPQREQQMPSARRPIASSAAEAEIADPPWRNAAAAYERACARDPERRSLADGATGRSRRLTRDAAR